MSRFSRRTSTQHPRNLSNPALLAGKSWSEFKNDLLVTMDRLTDSLVAHGFRVRAASRSGTDGEILRHLFQKVFVEERGYFDRVVEDDVWDETSQYFLVTMAGEPAGCVRLVDPLAFPSAAEKLPRIGNRRKLPMEMDFPLSMHLADAIGFYEVGRFILLPNCRGIGGLAALMGTSYLYGIQRNRVGAVGLSATTQVRTYVKVGWRLIGDEFFCESRQNRSQAIMIRADEVTKPWRDRFFAMEANGVITL